MNIRSAGFGALALATLAVAPTQGPGYHVAARYVLGGEGGWDYVTVDTAAQRIFIARGDRITVVDQNTGQPLGEIPGLNRAHGVAFAYRAGHGFATSGGDSTVVMFDLKTLKVLGRTIAADDADALLYDPASDRIFTFNGDAHSASVIDPVSGQRVANIDLGAKPESGATTGDGKVYVNLEEVGTVAEIDSKAMKVTRRWSLAPCKTPVGMAVDVAHRRLFSGCRDQLMAISDATAGKVLATVPIGAGVDGNAFDPSTGYAFSANGDGTLTVVGEQAGKWAVVQTVETMEGARTLGFDARTHRLYTVSAKFGPVPADASGANSRRRPPMIPGTFTLLVVDKE